MVEALANAAGLAGLLMFILGTFFLYASFGRQAERPRISASLGLMMMSAGVNFTLIYYTGGVSAYLQNGGSRAVGQVALWTRGFAAFFALILIIDSLRIWRRMRLKNGGKDA